MPLSVASRRGPACWVCIGSKAFACSAPQEAGASQRGSCFQAQQVKEADHCRSALDFDRASFASCLRMALAWILTPTTLLSVHLVRLYRTLKELCMELELECLIRIY